VEINRTTFDWSNVYLWAKGWDSKIIASRTPKNNMAESVANNLLANAETIYDQYINKPSGTFTKPVSNSNESLIKEINDLKQKVDELSKNKLLIWIY